MCDTKTTDAGLEYRETPRGPVAVDPPGYWWRCWGCDVMIPIRGDYDEIRDCPICDRRLAVNGPAPESALPDRQATLGDWSEE